MKADERKAWETHLEGKELAKARAKDEARAVTPATFDAFVALLQAHGLPAPQTEYLFAQPRKFRADYCWPDVKVIVEREGGIWAKKGRAKSAHSEPMAIIRDMEKSNLAQLAGFVFLRFTPKELESGAMLPALKILLETRKGT